MSPWLKTRLLSLFCGVLLVSGATYLHAQDDYGPPAKTPEEAATNFWKLLALVGGPQQGRSTPAEIDDKTVQALVGSISRPQYEWLSKGSAGNRTTDPVELMAKEAFTPAFEGQVQSSSDGQTIVSVAPPSAPKAREVVVVREEGGYRVDMVATYARWHHLTGLDADKALFKATGWVSPRLATQPGFVGSETTIDCQSHLRQIGLAVMQYTQDYDERLPPARRWQNVLHPYLRNQALYTCPAVATQGQKGGYAFNSNLSQISLARIESLARTVALYETSNLNRNVFAPFTGRAYRHTSLDIGNGLNIAFGDGHVKWYKSGVEQSLAVTSNGKNMFGAG